MKSYIQKPLDIYLCDAPSENILSEEIIIKIKQELWEDSNAQLFEKVVTRVFH
jgi:hypothetical protein